MGARVGNGTVGSAKVGRTRIGVAVGVVVNAGVRVGRGVSVARGAVGVGVALLVFGVCVAGAVDVALFVVGVGVRVAVDAGGTLVPVDDGSFVGVAEIARTGVRVGCCVGVADGRTGSIAPGLVAGGTPPAVLPGRRLASSSAAARMMPGSSGSNLGAERSTE